MLLSCVFLAGLGGKYGGLKCPLTKNLLTFYFLIFTFIHTLPYYCWTLRLLLLYLLSPYLYRRPIYAVVLSTPSPYFYCCPIYTVAVSSLPLDLIAATLLLLDLIITGPYCCWILFLRDLIAARPYYCWTLPLLGPPLLYFYCCRIFIITMSSKIP